MRKDDMLRHWQALRSDLPLAPSPVPYKHDGSTYDQDGIRITGSRDWIDSVLAKLAPLLAYENGQTRLQVTYQPSKDRTTGADLGSWNCYVQVHERGPAARHVNAIFGLGRPVPQAAE